MSRAPASEDVAAREPRQISRRTVAKGAAWSVPVIAFAAGTPAYAASPGSCEPRTCDELGSDLSFGSDHKQYRVAYFADTTAHTNSSDVFYTGGGNQAVGWSGSGWSFDKGLYQKNNCSQSYDPCSPKYKTENKVTLSDTVFTAQGDPKVKNASIVLSVVACLSADKTYTFKLQWISLNGNIVAAHMQMGVVEGDTGQNELPTGDNQVKSGTVDADRNNSITGGSNSKKVKNGKGALTLNNYQPTVTGTHTFYVKIWFDNASEYEEGTCSDCDAGANDFSINAPTVTCKGATK